MSSDCEQGGCPNLIFTDYIHFGLAIGQYRQQLHLHRSKKASRLITVRLGSWGLLAQLTATWRAWLRCASMILFKMPVLARLQGTEDNPWRE
jgi:hypothetical protein